MKRYLWLVMLAALPASAQWRHFGDANTRPTGYFGIGFATPVNPHARQLDDAGFSLEGGVGVTHDYVGIMLDTTFADFGINNSALLRAGARRGSEKYWALTVDPVFHVNERGPVDFYVTGGGGIYWQLSKLRTTANVGPSNSRYDLISSDTVAAPGVNGGVGFAYNLGFRRHMKVFIEARYHHMFAERQDVSFIPVTLGVRF